jgi:protein involved in polysaccharide export with SLBB domain
MKLYRQGIFLVVVAAVNGCVTGSSSSLPLTEITHGTMFSRIGDYQVGIGDELEFHYGAGDAPAKTVTVAAGGTAVLGEGILIPVAGMSIYEIGRACAERLGLKRGADLCRVTVNQRSSYRVHFVGAFAKPGVVTFPDTVSISQGIAYVGGFDTEARRLITIVRTHADGVAREYRGQFSAIVESPELRDIVLERGDVVIGD